MSPAETTAPPGQRPAWSSARSGVEVCVVSEICKVKGIAGQLMEPIFNVVCCERGTLPGQSGAGLLENTFGYLCDQRSGDF